MAPLLVEGGHGFARRSLQTQVSVGSTTLSLSAIIGIAVGGAVGVFAILASIGIVLARRKHRLQMQQMSEAKESGIEDADIGKALRSTRPPEICFSRRLSFNPFLILAEGGSASDWASEDPPVAKIKRQSTHLGFLRRSGTRDSWPLASEIHMKIIHGQATIHQSQVAPPGYVIEDPKVSRSNSRMSRRKSAIIHQEHANMDPDIPTSTPMRTFHRRSASENQLSTILRSTSERLKAAHRRSLTRTMSALGRYPGSPPTARLPTPPGKLTTESREALVGKHFSESVVGSICDSYRIRSLSPPKRSLRRSQPAVPRPNSPTSSNESRDSLCGAKTPDVVIPASLTSPSKYMRGERKSQVQFSLENAKDVSLMIHNDTRPSLEAIGGQDPLEQKKGLQRISLASDPFFSAVKSSKPIMPNSRIQGPRPQPPLYMRKATFGQEETSERPQSFCSPLKDVSGNVRHTPKNSQLESPTTNPFQWSPQEAMQTRSTQTSPATKRPSQRRKGHKRSNVVRMSVPRPLSSVEVVPEEEDEDSPLSLESPRQPAIRRLEPTKNQSSPPSSSRLSTRPPSSAVFNPTLKIPVATTRSEDNSPTLGLEDIRNGQVYSPTLSVCNYYTESGGASEDEFFRGRSSKQVDKTTLKSRRHGRNYSTDLSLFPTHQSQQERQTQLTSFPPPSLTNSMTPMLTPPSGRPLPSIDFSMSGGGVQLQSSATAAPPLLTLSTPTYLSGPRPEPSESNHKRNNSTINDASPQRISIQTSITLLRRMNSEVSHYSATSSPSDTNSPIVYHYGSISSLEQLEERRRSRPSSKYYLALGSSNLLPQDDNIAKVKQRVEKRDSHRVYKERRKRRNEELEREEVDLTPVKEVSSPATGANALGIVGLRFPTLSREGTNGATPPRESQGVAARRVGDITPTKSLGVSVIEVDGGDLDLATGEGRWSGAMTKPQHEVIRRESRMEHPSPKTPPKWGLGLGSMGLAGKRLLDADKENLESGGRPHSLGLYDQEGFLRSSPEREAARVERERVLQMEEKGRT
ncbi:hypothetical protein N431DRAFT_489319 [Stipitochalara longipes BDJ]|nr:hypothetical protein N431DRAFT_489319 [Stipitochalara longipes BDJ]